ncbi:MAG: hypothetical protein HOI06_07430, partial [Pelagibacteraceae bacterium]|nr:hypothetical protein [Pelagibacteraceae bacterium]
MKKVLYVLHQKTSVTGDIGHKFKERGFEADIIRPPLGDNLPDNLSTYSAIVVFGGPMSVNDDEDFIKEEIKWMKRVIDSDIPYLGICLGAQILAKYLGCDVVKNKMISLKLVFLRLSQLEMVLKCLKIKIFFINFILRVLKYQINVNYLQE